MHFYYAQLLNVILEEGLCATSMLLYAGTLKVPTGVVGVVVVDRLLLTSYKCPYRDLLTNKALEVAQINFYNVILFF